MPNTPTLHINLAAIQRNYRTLRAAFTGQECAAVVKADAYGLGAAPVAQALQQAGCTRFFVATPAEGAALRTVLPDAAIAVFHGPGPGEAETFRAHRLEPVLNDRAQLERWLPEGGPSLVHVDTGMTRLGFTENDLRTLAEYPEWAAQAGIHTVMSHFACATTPHDAKNREQLERFRAARALLPTLPASFCNSSGIYLGEEYHFDLARPGCALYGITPNPALPNPVEPVITLTAPILQLRTLDRMETVGYGATHAMPKGARIATIGFGYADGYFRMLSNKGSGFISGVEAPLVGRVSMDMVMLDVSHIPEALLTPETAVEFIGPHRDVNDFAHQAGTIGYEVLTRLGPRVQRVYHADGQAA